MSTHNIRLWYRTPKRYSTIISIMPPGMALIVTLRGSNYRCLEQIFMVLKGFEPSKFDCTCFHLYSSYNSTIVCMFHTPHLSPSLARQSKRISSRYQNERSAHKESKNCLRTQRMTKPTNVMYAQRRLISALASTQCDQNLSCPHEESLSP